MLVRSWNLFHGNTVPPNRRAYLDEMVSLVTGDSPDVLCLQEVPAWALGRFTVGDRSTAPSLGPLPVPAVAGRVSTALDHGRFRSLFSGQGNAIQVGPRLRVVAHDAATLNTRPFRRAQGTALGLDVVMRLAWAKERRVVQWVRLAHDDGRTFLVANTHCTSSRDQRIPAAELSRAARIVLGRAGPADVVVLAGDFNVAGDMPALQELASSLGFSPPGPGIDHVLVRGADASELRVWEPGRRERNGALLSDHAPVELEIR